MAEERDLERAWLFQFTACLDERGGEKIRVTVMEGSEGLSSRSGRQEVIHWTMRAMERFDSLVDEGKRKAILTGCACQYPKSNLQAMRKAYESREMRASPRRVAGRFRSHVAAVCLDCTAETQRDVRTHHSPNAVGA